MREIGAVLMLSAQAAIANGYPDALPPEVAVKAAITTSPSRSRRRAGTGGSPRPASAGSKSGNMNGPRA